MSNPGNTSPQPGVVGGFAPLNSGLLIPAQYLPSSSSRIGQLTGSVSTAGAAEAIALTSNAIPAGTLKVGSIIKFRAYGFVGAGTNTSKAFAARIGSTGTLADVVVASGVGWNNNNFGYELEGLVTIQTIGAAGTMVGSIMFNGNAGNPNISSTGFPAINTTVPNFVSITYNNSGGTGTGITMYQCVIELE